MSAAAGAGGRTAAPDPPGAPALRGEGLVVRYGGETVLEVDEIELRDGELLVVLGPNGAGKSTLMRVLAMLEGPSTGRVLHRGRAGEAAARRLRDVSTAVFQRPHLWSGPVADSLRLGLELAGVPGPEADRRLRDTVDALGLERLLDRDVDELSAGEAQRVALGRALAPDPEILFLDEPTANLDASARTRLRRDVERVARRGGRSTLLITHDRREAFRLADRIAVLEGGRLVRTGAPHELYERPGSRYVARVSGAELALRGRVVAEPGERAGAAGRDGGDEAPGGLVRVEVDGVRLLAVGRAEPDEEVAVAYRPEDLALAREEGAAAGGDDSAGDRARGAAPGAAGSPGDGGTGAGPEPAGVGHGPGRADAAAKRDSVRNSFAATVREVRDVRGLVRVRLAGPPDVVAVVTRGSAGSLGLGPGTRVRVRVKAAALHAFPRR